MSQAIFDDKFGPELLVHLSTGPGVYLFKNASGEVIYVGKAKNLRRRLRSYRNSSRKKAHRKMARLIKAAHGVSFELLGSEQEALLRENALIRELKPKFNVDGAYSFLYPALGVTTNDRHTLLCMTTAPEQFRSLGLSWFGTFRSRPRVKLAFESLIDLLGLIGHRENKSALPVHPRLRGSRLVGLRRVPEELTETLPWYFAGDDDAFVGTLATLLLQKPRARLEASQVEEKLKTIHSFHQTDAVPLRRALRKLGRPGSFVSGEQRDALFIQSRD